MDVHNRTYFLANVCHVCKSKSTPYTCEICRMVFYCSPEHRRNNWFDHSEICWAVNKICENGKCDVLWELLGGDFLEFRHEVANKCMKLLRRSLKPWELEMIYHPRMCNVCREFNWKNLSFCKNCEFIYTCKKNHFRKDHKNWCKKIKSYSDITAYLSLNKNVKPVEIEIKSEIYKSMADVLMQNYELNKKYKNVEIHRILTSELLTYPMTVYHGLKAINTVLERKLVILFIGAEIQAEVMPLNKWEKYLLHILPNVDFLNLKFLGPELQESDEEFLADLCETCRKERKSLKFQYISGKFYHEYSNNESSRPNLICAMNSGMYRDFGFGNENSWKKTIEKLFTLENSPVLITEYTRRELEMDLKRISNFCRNVNTIIHPEINPFASSKPGLNIISENESPVIFKNYFYTILQNNCLVADVTVECSGCCCINEIEVIHVLSSSKTEQDFIEEKWAFI